MARHDLSLQFVVIFTVLWLHTNTIFDTYVAAALLIATPLWSENDTTSCGIHAVNLSEGSPDEGYFIFDGDPNRVCVIDLNLSVSENIQVTFLGYVTSVGYFEFWIERLGALRECQFKYEFVLKQPTMCGVVFQHKHLQMNLQGNVSLGLKVIPATGSSTSCLKDHHINITMPCMGVTGYNETVLCNVHQDEDYRRYTRSTIPFVCRFDFNSECGSTLQYQKQVVFHCADKTPPDTKRIIFSTNVAVIDLIRNKLESMASGSFFGLSNVLVLDLSNNILTTLSSGIFQGLTYLQSVHITNNFLRSIIDPDIFHDIPKLSYMYLDHNNLTELSGTIFHGLSNLRQLFLDTNNLTSLTANIFQNLTKLEVLQIAYNKLSSLDQNLFQGLFNLRGLGIAGNLFTTLPRDVFKGLFNLELMYMGKNNPFTNFDSDIFRDLHKLSFCELTGGNLQTVPNIAHMNHLQVFDIENNPLTNINSGTFADAPSGANIFVTQHEICECYMTTTCIPLGKRSPYLTCDRLLSDRVLVVFIWVIGLNALAGNLFVMAWKLLAKSQRNAVQDRLLTSLALSDLLMGIYMIAIASADVHFGESFPMKAESWRSSIVCKVSGAISIISSESSVFFVTLISLDRFVNMQFPYSSNRLGRKSVMVIIVCTWVFALFLGIIPSSLAGMNSKFYDNSHVCIGLPLALLDEYAIEYKEIEVRVDRIEFTRTESQSHFQGQVRGLYFSTAVFLGLNGICYFIILFCYIGIIRAVRKSSQSIRNTQEMKHQLTLTDKVAAIVATDFCCWFPVIILGTLVQCRVVTLPPSVFAWLVTFIIPINSAINPYLYTISALVGRVDRSRKPRKDQSVSDTTRVKTGDDSKVTTSTISSKV